MLKVKIFTIRVELMFCMRHVQIYDGQRHKDERLQGNNQDVENGPAKL